MDNQRRPRYTEASVQLIEHLRFLLVFGLVFHLAGFQKRLPTPFSLILDMRVVPDYFIQHSYTFLQIVTS